jgi:predicted RNA-binding Zn ribbon-like protein
MNAGVNTESPHGLDLVVDFVNTLDIDDRTDALRTPADLATWLADHGLSDGSAPSGAEHRRAIALREALRGALLRHNGVDAGDDPAAELERAADRGGLRVHFHDADAVALAPSAAGVDGALARILVPIANATADGTWSRVKACRAGDCHWAFYDRSRNRAGVWCDMAVCGNRTKVRTFRERLPRP